MIGAESLGVVAWAQNPARVVGSGFIQFPPQRPFTAPVISQPPTVVVSPSSLPIAGSPSGNLIAQKKGSEAWVVLIGGACTRYATSRTICFTDDTFSFPLRFDINLKTSSQYIKLLDTMGHWDLINHASALWITRFPPLAI